MSFNLHITAALNPCVDSAYYFKHEVEEDYVKVAGTTSINLLGGIAPFTWSCDGEGSFANASTFERYNVLTCNSLPSDSLLNFTITDSCGTVITGAVAAIGYNPGEGCSATNTPLAVIGTEEPVVGSIYSASGGTSPYSYSFDSGTIDSVTGEILSITGCGAGYVTITDAFGNTSVLEVRLPGGYWTYNDSIEWAAGLEGSTSNCGSRQCYIGAHSYTVYFASDSLYNNYTSLLDYCGMGAVGNPANCSFVIKVAHGSWQCA